MGQEPPFLASAACLCITKYLISFNRLNLALLDKILINSKYFSIIVTKNSASKRYIQCIFSLWENSQIQIPPVLHHFNLRRKAFKHLSFFFFNTFKNEV